jgi:hypothetical protein
MNAVTRWGCAIATIGAVLAVSTSAAQSASMWETARVSGAAEFTLPFSPDKDVRTFAFAARAVPYSRPLPGLPTGSPADATGTVRVKHWVAQANMTVTFEAAVDCLVTSPGTATLTAVVTRADEPVRDWIGTRVGFSVQDGDQDRAGRDRVGFTWSLSADQNDAGEWGAARVGTCVAPAPFAPVTRGNYTVRHAELTPPPANR